jgi:hypothetical protein
VLENFTISLLSKLQQVRYEQVETFDEMAKMVEKLEESTEEVP